MMDSVVYTCIVCPKSCKINVAAMEDGTLNITGNQCLRGQEHAVNEHHNPKRMVTTVIRINGAKLRCLPVISTDEVPKERLRDCLLEIYEIQVEAPVKAGEAIINNICNTGVDIVAARSLKARCKIQ
jgi:CxxC motif-containing protein